MSRRRVVFIVTQDCQLRCNYCYLVGKNKTGRMTWDIAKQSVDFLLSLPVMEDTAIIDFIGGEPLLEIDLITKISEYFVAKLKQLNHPWLKNYSFRFTTNGLLYASKKVQSYIRKYKSHLSIQLSIDGTKQKHDMNRVFPNGQGSYDSLISNIDLWICQFGKKAQSFTVISHNDLPFLSESVIHLINLGIKDIIVSMVVEDVWTMGDDEILEKELMIVANYVIDHKLWNEVSISLFNSDVGKPEKDDHIFPCGKPMLVFSYDGIIYTCVRFVNFSLRSKAARPIGTISTGIDCNLLRPLLTYSREAFYPEQCLKCEISTGCRWCPAENYDASDTGTIFQRTLTVCQLHKATIRVKNYFWNRISYLENYER